MSLTDITNYINNNVDDIIDNLEHESIEVHKYLIKRFNHTNVVQDLPFQFLYRSFYRLDNAGLTPGFKAAYFKVLEGERFSVAPDIRIILEKLRYFRNKKDQENMQFSFATKLANTINSRYPIYDSEVASVFGFTRPIEKDFKEKLNKYLLQFEHIRKAYETILADELLAPAIKRFDSKFKSHNLSDMKRLDFIFWSAGKLLKKEKEIFKKAKKAVPLETAGA